GLQERTPDGGIPWVRGGGLGIQRVGFTFSGDRGRSFPQFEGTVKAALSLSVSGMALSGHDLGGYTGGEDPDAGEVYVRGAQFAAFSPAFQDHGSAPAPWEQDDYGRENYKFYTRVRYNLLPYLYHYVKVAHDTGAPIMRTLFLHYPGDEKTYGIEDEYMLGEQMLAAPFVGPGTKREIYLPEGGWVDFWDGVEYEGGRTIEYERPLNRIPVFVKRSSIIPLELNEELEIGGLFPQEKKSDLLLTFAIFGDGDCEFEFFDGRGFMGISAARDGDDLKVVVDRIGERFGVRARGLNPAYVRVNGEPLPRRAPGEMGVAASGWRYDFASRSVLVKINPVRGAGEYVVEIGDLNASGAPPAPEIVSVTAGDGSAEVSFTTQPEASSYKLAYGTAPGRYEERVSGIAGSPVRVDGLRNGVSYYFAVRGVNSRGEGVFSGEVSAVPRAGTAPPAPSIVRADGWDGRIDVRFTPVGNARSYVVKYGVEEGKYEKKDENVISTSHTIRNLKNGVRYFVTVSAVNEYGEGPDSDPPAAAAPVLDRGQSFAAGAGGIFIEGHHYTGKKKHGGGKIQYVYGVRGEEGEKLAVWVKARNVSIFEKGDLIAAQGGVKVGEAKVGQRYFKWYVMGEIEAGPRGGLFSVVFDRSRVEIGRIFLTAEERDRPFLKSEEESGFLYPRDAGIYEGRMAEEFSLTVGE
ncbi:MAG: TIM-barrel domain-containing protein, partial [bacterium]